MRASLAVALACLAPGSAAAFECSVVDDCDETDLACRLDSLTVGWNQRCIPVWVHAGDPLFGSEAGQALVRAAFDRWTAEVDCTDMEIVFVGTTSDRSGFDSSEPDRQTNVVLATRDRSELELAGPEVIGLTLSSFSPETGEIFDADILLNLNAAEFVQVEEDTAACASPTPLQPWDIENTLVHEVGHFLGFDHVSDEQATMYAFSPPCEVQKRDLAPDDVAAVCSVYPVGEPVRTCRPPMSYALARGDPSTLRNQCERALDEGCGCRTRSGQDVGGVLPVGLGLALWLGFRRRRRR